MIYRDGTYYKDSHGHVFNYGERWEYGYIVGTHNVVTAYDWISAKAISNAIARIPNGSLFGIWRGPFNGTHATFLDYVQHIDTRSEAITLAREFNQSCIWDMREHKTIDTESEAA